MAGGHEAKALGASHPSPLSWLMKRLFSQDAGDALLRRVVSWTHEAPSRWGQSKVGQRWTGVDSDERRRHFPCQSCFAALPKCVNQKTRRHPFGVGQGPMEGAGPDGTVLSRHSSWFGH
jgi:hypothetical protein